MIQSQHNSIHEKIIVALDNMELQEIHEFMQKISGTISTIKIGMELFYKYGRSLIEELHQKYQVKIFLDLKLHDIPNTVSKAIHSLHGLPISFLTLHLSGGKHMIEQAISAAQISLPDTKLLGVSYLTSLNNNDFYNILGLEEDQINNAFSRLFKIALETQIHGVVLSGHEIEQFDSLQKENKMITLIKVCPGIRFQDEIEDKRVQDQNRVMSPITAIKKGADFLVIGRSLTQSNNLNKRLNEDLIYK